MQEGAADQPHRRILKATALCSQHSRRTPERKHVQTYIDIFYVDKVFSSAQSVFLFHLQPKFSFSSSSGHHATLVARLKKMTRDLVGMLIGKGTDYS